ncbi:MAG: DUF1800 family protein, partial [Pyrinomonadaceae bacterium]|nr:DUF1800 family protein [Pyrinomonadaceae bacterium]
MFRRNILTKLAAAFLLISLAAPTLSFAAVPASKPLSEDQKILHVLNRLGFGARPGDIERVKKIGVRKYIQQQLSPSSIDDSVAETKVDRLEIFKMSTAEVFAKYPNPGALLRELEGRTRRANANNAMPPANEPEQMTEADRRERRQKLQEYYRRYDLRPAQQLVPQIAANRVLRAVYSERQLQEV